LLVVVLEDKELHLDLLLEVVEEEVLVVLGQQLHFLLQQPLIQLL
jgi:hypothetical protein